MVKKGLILLCLILSGCVARPDIDYSKLSEKDLQCVNPKNEIEVLECDIGYLNVMYLSAGIGL